MSLGCTGYCQVPNFGVSVGTKRGTELGIITSRLSSNRSRTTERSQGLSSRVCQVFMVSLGKQWQVLEVRRGRKEIGS